MNLEFLPTEADWRLCLLFPPPHNEPILIVAQRYCSSSAIICTAEYVWEEGTADGRFSGFGHWWPEGATGEECMPNFDENRVIYWAPLPELPDDIESRLIRR